MKKEIFELVNQLKNKAEFMRAFALHSGYSFQTIKINWVYGQSIPEEHQPMFLEFLENYLDIQNELQADSHN